MVVPQHGAVPAARVHDPRVAGIRCDVADLESANRIPVAKTDLAVIATAREGDGAAVLLRRVQTIRECVVNRDVVELSRRLSLQEAPRPAGVGAADCGLVNAGERALGRT